MYTYLQISFFLWSNTSVVQNRSQTPFVIYWGWPRQRETQRACQKALATNSKYCNPLSIKECSAKTTDTRKKKKNKATSQEPTCELSKASMEWGEVTRWTRKKKTVTRSFYFCPQGESASLAARPLTTEPESSVNSNEKVFTQFFLLNFSHISIFWGKKKNKWPSFPTKSKSTSSVH